MNKFFGYFLLFIVLLLAGCGTELQPDEIYNQAKENLQQETDSVYFTSSQALTVNEETVSFDTNGAVRYEPMEGYMVTQMNLIDFQEALEFHFYIDGENISMVDGGERIIPDADIDEVMSVFNPIEHMNEFNEVEEAMLMKETDEHYEVSIRTDNEAHIHLIEHRMEGWESIDGEVDDDTFDSIDIERIDMLAWINKETYQLDGFSTRYRFNIETGAQPLQIDERQDIFYSYHNNVPEDLESFVQQVPDEEIEEDL
ncbi:hypothetical protein HNR44_002420 [Geomicrobium halophilum]|uniref:Uncharacterized protein n=1 Tax=Geomicrobium halophilum TaxID=549000 RepID=A0A841PNM1_9BACL|nr:DUF6612 family protein [Geomicrobium halophilum]MBB6450437.1 hypothetical protein [Geomicrobium halophilum]